MSNSSQAAAHHQEQQELQQDVERIVELACRALSPADGDLLRWACGVQRDVSNWRQLEMNCTCGED